MGVGRRSHQRHLCLSSIGLGCEGSEVWSTFHCMHAVLHCQTVLGPGYGNRSEAAFASENFGSWDLSPPWLPGDTRRIDSYACFKQRIILP